MDNVDDIKEIYHLFSGKVHFEKRMIDGVEKIIVFGKNSATRNSAVDIPQRIINAKNLPEYRNIGKYMDVDISMTKAFEPWSDVLKGTAKAFDYLGVAGDVVGVIIETGYEVSQYEDSEDRWKVGIYTASTEIIEAAATTVTTAVVTPLATAATTAIATKAGSAIGTAIAPGIGTVVGFVVGLGVGWFVGKISDWGKDRLMD